MSWLCTLGLHQWGKEWPVILEELASGRRLVAARRRTCQRCKVRNIDFCDYMAFKGPLA